MSTSMHFLTIFPDLIAHYLSFGLLGKAIEKGLFTASVYDLRDYSQSKSRSVDDRVYGGGPGMVFRPEPLARAITALRSRLPDLYVIYPSPCGAVFNQTHAQSLSAKPNLLFICGRYEGVDHRTIYQIYDF